MNIKVDKKSKEALYWQIYSQIKSLIIDGSIQHGSYLPSERPFAEELGVHRNTVIRAYGELKGEQLIVSRQGIGYQVSYKSEYNSVRQYGDLKSTESSKKQNKNSSNSSVKNKLKDVNWGQMIKDEYRDVGEKFDKAFQMQGKGTKISMAVGIPPIIYDEEEIAAHIACILKENGKKESYITPYQGDEGCRRQIVSYLRGKGIRAKMSEIQVMSETNQAFDFIMTATLRPGDKIIIEEPVSPDVYRLIDLNDCKAITVPVDENGMKCENLGAMIEKYKPKYIYINSSYHDPTGACLSVARKKELLDISYRYRIPIIEDDSGSELNFFGNPEPTLKSMDEGSNVIYIYSFALSFVPGLSMAFIVAPEELARSLRYLVSVRLMSLEWVAQKLIARCLADGSYIRKTAEIRRRNRENFRTICPFLDELKPYGLSYHTPKGGVYIWVKLPTGLDSRKVVLEAERRGVSFIAGTVFYPDRMAGKDKIRINFSHEKKNMVIEGMKIFSAIIREMVEWE